MKTTELVSKLTKLGYTVKVIQDVSRGSIIRVIEKNGSYTLITISEKQKYKLNNLDTYFDSLTEREQDEIMEIVWEYIKTPVENRETIDKWYVSVPTRNGRIKLLGKDTSKDIEFANLDTFIYASVDDRLLNNEHQLTKEQIMELPYEWRPTEFDGLGFAKCVKVEGENYL